MEHIRHRSGAIITLVRDSKNCPGEKIEMVAWRVKNLPDNKEKEGVALNRAGALAAAYRVISQTA